MGVDGEAGIDAVGVGMGDRRGAHTPALSFIC